MSAAISSPSLPGLSVTTKQDAAAVEATVAQQVWRDGFGEMAALVAGCFPRRETRQTFREMTEAMLMGVARAPKATATTTGP